MIIMETQDIKLMQEKLQNLHAEYREITEKINATKDGLRELGKIRKLIENRIGYLQEQVDSHVKVGS